MRLYTSVTFRCGRSSRTSSFHWRSMASEEHDQIVFSRKTTARTSGTHTCGTPIFLPSHSSRGSTYPIRLIVWRGSRQQWQRAPPLVFITADFPDGGKSSCTCSRNGCGEEKEERGGRERTGTKRKREGEGSGENVSVLLRVVLYKPTTTVRLPLLCRELITNPVARPPSYLDPARLTFSTPSSILHRLPIGYLSARSIGQDSFLIPIYAYCHSGLGTKWPPFMSSGVTFYL